jgi:hypothetical protein
MREHTAPPSSLTRRADEQTLQDVEREIHRWLFSYVQRWRCVDPESHVGKVLHPMKDEEVRAFVAAHFRELWDKVLPERLKQEYAEAQARQEAGPTGTAGAPAAGGDERPAEQPRESLTDNEYTVLRALRNMRPRLVLLASRF